MRSCSRRVTYVPVLVFLTECDCMQQNGSGCSPSSDEFASPSPEDMQLASARRVCKGDCCAFVLLLASPSGTTTRVTCVDTCSVRMLE